jgi:hypothetical protein
MFCAKPGKCSKIVCGSSGSLSSQWFPIQYRYHTPPTAAPVPVPTAAPVTAAPVPVAAPTALPVVSLTLVNANTDLDIGPLADGMTIDLTALGSALNVRGNPIGVTLVRSVVFRFDGNIVKTENGAPYTLGGDSGTGNYYPWTPSLGVHTITATAHSSFNGLGSIVAMTTVSFTVTKPGRPVAAPVSPPVAPPVPAPVSLSPVSLAPVSLAPVVAPAPVSSSAPVSSAPVAAPVPVSSSAPVSVTVPVPTTRAPTVPPTRAPTVPVPPAVIALVLINAATDVDIGPLTNGMTIKLSTLGRMLNIRAQPIPPAGAGVKSVVFTYDNLPFRIESGAPYAFAGDAAGNYHNWTPAIGTHVITATAYSALGGLGTVLATVTVSITVVA